MDQQFQIKTNCLACGQDLTDEIRIKCAEEVCLKAYFCLLCFGNGVEPSGFAHRKTHRYQVMEVLDFPLYEGDWAADEEWLLVEASSRFGLGNWEAIALHVGTKTRQECADHYVKVYLDSPKWPLPKSLLGNISRQKARDTLREIASQRASLPYQKPIVTANRPLISAPANHEIKGFMPGRGEFDVEPDHTAEELVGDVDYSGRDLDPSDPYGDLKRTLFDIYNDKLTIRQEKKTFLFDRGLIDHKRIVSRDKRKPKEEFYQIQRLRAFSRFMPKCDLTLIEQNLDREWQLRRRIAQLQDWRRMGLTSLSEGEDYEREKRNHSDSSSVTSTPHRLAPTIIYPRNRPTPRALDIQDMAGVHLLQPAEQEICSRLRVSPQSYLKIKQFMMEECRRRNGLRKRTARELVQMDVNKTSRLWDFFANAGWVWNPADSEVEELLVKKKRLKST
jgi:transcriptional adapter 2-alpha